MFRLREPLKPEVAERIRREQRECYRLHRARVLALHREKYGSESMPWSWWAMESPEPRDQSMSEADQLAAMGALSRES